MDLANTIDVLSNTYRRQLKLDAMTSEGNLTSTSAYLDLQMNGVFVHGKQDTGAELNAMPLNIYDQMNMKLKGKLELRPCSDVNIVGYNKQSIECMGKVVVKCQHGNTTKNAAFYVTSVNDINTKLRSNDMKAHVMELFPDLFDGIGMIKDAIMNLDITPDAVPIVQLPRKVPQAMIEPLKS